MAISRARIMFLVGVVAICPLPAMAQAMDLEPVVEGLTRPVFVTHAGDGSGRLFVVEQEGRILIVEDGALLSEPFLDLTARVVSGESAVCSVSHSTQGSPRTVASSSTIRASRTGRR